MPRLFRMFCALACVGALAACGDTGQIPDAPLAQAPIDFATAQKAARAAYPDAQRFGLLDTRGDGFVIGIDGTAEYRAFGSRSALRTRTTVDGLTGNSVCLAPADGWSGACLTLTGERDGPIDVKVRFGNGTERSYATALTVDPD